MARARRSEPDPGRSEAECRYGSRPALSPGARDGARRRCRDGGAPVRGSHGDRAAVRCRRRGPGRTARHDWPQRGGAGEVRPGAQYPGGHPAGPAGSAVRRPPARQFPVGDQRLRYGPAVPQEERAALHRARQCLSGQRQARPGAGRLRACAQAQARPAGCAGDQGRSAGRHGQVRRSIDDHRGRCDGASVGRRGAQHP